MIRRGFKGLRTEERGATAVEYSVFVGLIAAVVVLAVASLGGATSSNLDCTGKAWQTKSAACTNSASTADPTSSPTVAPTPTATAAPTASPTAAPTSGNGNGNGNGGAGNGNGNGNGKH